jgi:hypothetical protein
MKKKIEIDQYLKNRLAQGQAEPSVSAWQKISEGIASQPVEAAHKRKKWMLASLLFIGILSLTILSTQTLQLYRQNQVLTSQLEYNKNHKEIQAVDSKAKKVFSPTILENKELQKTSLPQNMPQTVVSIDSKAKHFQTLSTDIHSKKHQNQNSDSLNFSISNLGYQSDTHKPNTLKYIPSKSKKYKLKTHAQYGFQDNYNHLHQSKAPANTFQNQMKDVYLTDNEEINLKNSLQNNTLSVEENQKSTPQIQTFIENNDFTEAVKQNNYVTVFDSNPPAKATLSNLDTNHAVKKNDTLIVESLSKSSKKPSIHTQKEEGKTIKKFSLEAIFAPEWSYRNAQVRAKASDIDWYKRNDQSTLQWSAGLLVQWQLHPKIYFKSGLLYNTYGDRNNSTFQYKNIDTLSSRYEVKFNSGMQSFPTTDSVLVIKSLAEVPSIISSDISQRIPDFDPDVYKLISTSIYQQDMPNYSLEERWQYSTRNTSTEYVITKSITEKNISNQVNQSNKYLGIPILLGSSVQLGRFSLGVFSGVIANLLVSSNRMVAYTLLQQSGNEAKLEYKELELKRLNFTYWGGLELAYQLSPRCMVTLSPNVKYFINSVVKDSQILEQRPFNRSLQVGVRFSLH